MSNPELRTSLEDALATAHLEGRLDDAYKWCEENGAWDLKELITEDVFPDFANEIGLKRLEGKRLLQAFKEAVGVEASPDASPSGTGALSKELSFGGYGAPCGVVVRNTFLDYDRRPNSTELGNRAATLPVHLRTRDASEEDDEDDDDEGVAGAEAGDEGKLSSPQESFGSAGHASSPVAPETSSLLKEKLTTFDAYESSAYWDWQGGISGDPHMSSITSPQLNQTALESAGAEGACGSDMAANAVFVPTPMWGMPPMMFPMMPMTMDGAAQAQLQMAMAGGMMMGGGCETGLLPGPVADPKPRSQVMERVFSAVSQRERIRWTVDARKLKSSDREAVSPTFEVSCGGLLKFRMVLKPKAMGNQKGDACFKKSRSKGYVELRCVTELESELHAKPILMFRLQVASAKRTEPFRGPLRHNFADRAICGLPEGQDEWDFGKVVDHSNNTFGIVLELLKNDF